MMKNVYEGCDKDFLNAIDNVPVYVDWVEYNNNLYIKVVYIHDNIMVVEYHGKLYGRAFFSSYDENMDIIKEFYKKMGIYSSSWQVFTGVITTMPFSLFDEMCKRLQHNRDERAAYNEKFNSGPVRSRVSKAKIDIRRAIGNSNKNTFDFINVEVPVCISDYGEALEFCSANITDLISYAVEYMERSKRYQKFGVPTTFLRVDNVTLTRQKVLNILFSLKEV